jgi:outer membrane lipase/esterase
MRLISFNSLLLVVALYAPAAASPYTSLLVFGDSLSDVGNTSAATLGFSPGSNYFQGRYSNGPVYAERLATGLGLGTLTRSGAGGNDFAYGGARLTGTGGFTGLFINDLDEQVSDYLNRLGSQPAPAGALFVVFIGANDLFNGVTNTGSLASGITNQAQRLVNAGARNLLTINLPRLGLTPDYNRNPTSATSISSLTIALNDALASSFAALGDARPDVTIHSLDVEKLFDNLVANPTQWGFTNVLDKGQGVADATGYVFWDGVHPTARGHTLLSEAALQAVLPTGDYNRDGFVTPADYTAWQSTFAGRFATGSSLTADGAFDGVIDAADYTVWRDRVGVSAVGVPEPAGLALIAAGIISTFVLGIKLPQSRN